MKSIMINTESPQQKATLSIDQALQQAITHHQTGQLQEAERIYRAILQFHPNHPDANHNLGVLEVQANRPTAGLPYFKAALEANLNQDQYRLSYIDALIQAGQICFARQVLAQGQQRGLQGEAADILAGRLEQPSRSEPSIQEKEALVTLFNEARYTEAVALAQMMTECFPLHGFGWKALGTIFQQMGQSADALPPIQKAAILSPNDAEAHSNLGVALQDMGRLDEAEISFLQALKIKPDLAEAHYNLGAILQDMDRLDEAEVSFRQALEIKPDYIEAHCSLGNILQGMGRLDEAEGSYRQVLEIDAGLDEVHYSLGNILKDMGRLDEAETSYRRTLEIKPDYVEALNNLGIVLQDMGRLDEAEASYRRALHIKPDYADALINLGNTFQDTGRLDEAEACYRAALKYKPNYATIHFNLHSLLLNPDDMTPSIKCLEKAVEIDPFNAQYRLFLGVMLDYSGDPEAAAGHFDGVEEASSNLHRARLDAWRYLKSANNTLPLIIGSKIQAFKLGIDIATHNGLVLEFGVRFGASIRQIAALADQEVHGFDSFEGLPEQWHHNSKGSYSTKGVVPEVPGNVTLHAGWFENTLPEFLKNYTGPVRFVNIDCDLYSSTKTVLDLLANRIIPGTVIVFDEYIGNLHWREDEFKAFQESVVKYGWNYEYICFGFITKQVVIRIL